MTVARDKYLDALMRLGCSVVNARGVRCGLPPVPHHPTGVMYRGASQKALDILAIPLCPTHHNMGNKGEAYHAGEKTWQLIHGRQEEHIIRNWRRLGIVPETLLVHLDEESKLAPLLKFLRRIDREMAA